ncbi:MAG: leucine-rich repeat domain-containing protein [Clostridia bacterium]|nr:leucine-rich repeat domain-containing protein [Clostridia bacterium]
MSIVKNSDDLSGYSIGSDGEKAEITAFFDSEATEIYLPSTYNGVEVSRIGFGAFRSCRQVHRIIFPDTIRTVDHSAFRACPELEAVVMSRNLESIADYAFAGCRKLRSITVPSDMRPISVKSFEKCYSLTEMNVYDKNREDCSPRRFVVPSQNESRRYGFMNACLTYFDEYNMGEYDKGYSVVQEFDDIFNIAEFRLKNPEQMNDYLFSRYRNAIRMFLPKLIKEDQVERVTSAGELGLIDGNSIDDYIKMAMPLRGNCIAYLLDLKEHRFKRSAPDFSL